LFNKHLYISRTKKYILLFFLSAIVFSGCIDFPKEIILPRYNVTLSFPISDTTYSLTKALENDSNIVASDDPATLGLLYYVTSEKISTVTVGESIEIESFTGNFSQSIGDIKIEAIPPIFTTIPVEQWIPGVVSGISSAVPETSAETITNFNAIEQFESVTFGSGEIAIKIYNNLPVNTEVRGFKLVNVDDGSIFLERPSSEIIFVAPFDSASISINLAGHTAHNSIQFIGMMYTPGSNGVVEDIPFQAGTLIAAEMRNYTVSNVRAVLPPQEPVLIDSVFVIDDSTFIQKAVFEKGSMNLEFNSFIDVDLVVSLELKNLFDAQGNVYTTQINLDRGEQNKTISIPSIAGWEIRSQNPGEMSNEIAFGATVTVVTSDEVREISSVDSVSVNFELSDIVLRSISGKIKPTLFALEESTFGFDLGDLKDNFMFDSLRFNNPEFILNLNSTIGFELSFDTQLDASNGITERSISLPLVMPANGLSSFNLADYGFTEMLNGFTVQLPVSFRFSGSAVINPAYLSGDVSMSDSISGWLDMSFPFDLGIAGGTFLDTLDVDSTGISEDDINSIKSLDLTIEFENGIPVELSFIGYVVDDEGNPLLRIPPVYNAADKITIIAPNVDGQGFTIAPASSKTVLSLTGEDAKTFLRNNRIAVTISFLTPPANSNNPVKFRVTDSVRLKLYAKAILKVNSD
jgi:hypothetical protein